MILVLFKKSLLNFFFFFADLTSSIESDCFDTTSKFARLLFAIIFFGIVMNVLSVVWSPKIGCNQNDNFNLQIV